MYALITGFPDNINALQCEWRIKHPDNKRIRPGKYSSAIGRIKGLNEVLKLEKWTNQSTHMNADYNFTVWIQKDFSHLLTDLPKNIKVVPVNSIAETLQEFTSAKEEEKKAIKIEKQVIKKEQKELEKAIKLKSKASKLSVDTTSIINTIILPTDSNIN